MGDAAKAMPNALDTLKSYCLWQKFSTHPNEKPQQFGTGELVKYYDDKLDELDKLDDDVVWKRVRGFCVFDKGGIVVCSGAVTPEIHAKILGSLANVEGYLSPDCQLIAELSKSHTIAPVEADNAIANHFLANYASIRPTEYSPKHGGAHVYPVLLSKGIDGKHQQLWVNVTSPNPRIFNADPSAVDMFKATWSKKALGPARNPSRAVEIKIDSTTLDADFECVVHTRNATLSRMCDRMKLDDEIPTPTNSNYSNFMKPLLQKDWVLPEKGIMLADDHILRANDHDRVKDMKLRLFAPFCDVNKIIALPADAFEYDALVFEAFTIVVGYHLFKKSSQSPLDCVSRNLKVAIGSDEMQSTITKQIPEHLKEAYDTNATVLGWCKVTHEFVAQQTESSKTSIHSSNRKEEIFDLYDLHCKHPWIGYVNDKYEIVLQNKIDGKTSELHYVDTNSLRCKYRCARDKRPPVEFFAAAREKNVKFEGKTTIPTATADSNAKEVISVNLTFRSKPCACAVLANLDACRVIWTNDPKDERDYVPATDFTKLVGLKFDNSRKIGSITTGIKKITRVYLNDKGEWFAEICCTKANNNFKQAIKVETLLKHVGGKWNASVASAPAASAPAASAPRLAAYALVGLHFPRTDTDESKQSADRRSGLTSDSTAHDFGISIDGAANCGEIMAAIFSQLSNFFHRPIVAMSEFNPIPATIWSPLVAPHSHIITVGHNLIANPIPRHTAFIPNMPYTATGATIVNGLCILDLKGGERICMPIEPAFTSNDSSPIHISGFDLTKVANESIAFEELTDISCKWVTGELRHGVQVQATSAGKYSVVQGSNWGKVWTADMPLCSNDVSLNRRNMSYKAMEERPENGCFIRFDRSFQAPVDAHYVHLILTQNYVLTLLNQRRTLPDFEYKAASATVQRFKDALISIGTRTDRAEKSATDP